MVLGQTYSYLAEVLHYTLPEKRTQPLLGKDMGDGWETRRSREPNHKDWVIIKLYVNNLLFDVPLTSTVRGAPGNLEAAEIDTANFVGNYPESAELHAILSEKVRDALIDSI